MNTYAPAKQESSLVSKTYGGTDALDKELQRHDEFTSTSSGFNKPVAGAGSNAYQSRVQNNQRRAFIPDYATGQSSTNSIVHQKEKAPYSIYGGSGVESSTIGTIGERQGTAGQKQRMAGGGSVFSGLASRQILGSNPISDFGIGSSTNNAFSGGRH